MSEYFGHCSPEFVMQMLEILEAKGAYHLPDYQMMRFWIQLEAFMGDETNDRIATEEQAVVGNWLHSVMALLWMPFEYFMGYETNDSLAAQKWAVVEAQLLEIHQKAFRPSGIGLLPRFTLDHRLIRGVHLSGHEGLISLFLQYLPTPPASFFSGYPLPPHIHEKQVNAGKSIRGFLAGQGKEVAQVIRDVVTVQRLYKEAILATNSTLGV